MRRAESLRGQKQATACGSELLERRVLLSLSPAGAEFRANTFTTNVQLDAAVASDADGDFVVVWSGAGSGDSFSGIFAQRYNAAGVAQGGEFRVNTPTAPTQSHPDVAMDADGDFVVAWQSEFQEASGTGVYAQRYNAAGVPQGEEFHVNTFTTNHQGRPSVAMDASGNFVIAWESVQEAGPTQGIYAQRYNAAGQPQGGEFHVNTFTPNTQREPDIAMDADGDFVIAWRSRDQNGSGYGVYAQRFDSAGTAQGGEFQVDAGLSGPVNVDPVAVAMDAGGDFVVVFDTANQSEVRAQRFDAAGVAQGGPIPVNTSTAGQQFEPAVAMDADGDFLVTWTSDGQDGSGLGVYGQSFDAAGVKRGGEFRVNTFTTGGQRKPAVAVNADGDAVVAWQGNGTGDTYGVYAQRYAESNPDVAAPVVGGLFVNGEPVAPGQRLENFVLQIIVFFSEDMSVAGGTFGVNSATNRANYRLTRAGVDVSSQIRDPSFSFNATTRRFQASLFLSPELRDGSYVLTVRDAVRDVAGNPLDGDLDGAPGGDFSRAFSVATVRPVGAEFRVNATTASDQTDPAVARDPATGNFVVAWQGKDNEGRDEIFARRFRADGVPLTSEFRVNDFSPGHQRFPAIAMDADGDFVVTWSGSGATDSEGVYAKRFRADTVGLGAEFRVNTFAVNLQERPAVATDAAGNFVITWQGRGQDDGFGVFAQRYNAAGVAQGGEFRVNTTIDEQESFPDIGMNGNGDFVIVWGSGVNNENELFAQRYNAAGVAQGGEVNLTPPISAGQDTFPSVAMDASGGFVVAWHNLSGNAFAMRYSASGSQLGSRFPVNDGGDAFQTDIAMDPDGDFVITWANVADSNSPADVFARRYNSNGAARGDRFPVNTFTAGAQFAPAVAVGDDGQFVIAWASEGQDGDGYGVYAQRYARNQSPFTAGIANVTVPQDAPDTILNLRNAFDDPDDPDASLTFSVVDNTNPLLFTSTTVNNATGTLRLDYAPGTSGTATITVGATDPGGLFAQTSFLVTVTPAPDTSAPRVTGVFVDGSAWTAAFRQQLAAAGQGSATLGFRIGAGAAQLDELPWVNVNRVRVVFSEDVIVAADDLSITGVNVAAYALDAAAFGYDPATFTATWTLAAPGNAAFPADKVRLDLDAGPGGVADKSAAANALDGDWVDGVSAFPSGNGAAGGDFLFNFRVLPGDVNRDGTVSIADINLEKLNFGQAASSLLFADLNGDDLISIVDLNVAKANFGKSVPA